jgi:hypothetical protein
VALELINYPVLCLWIIILNDILQRHVYWMYYFTALPAKKRKGALISWKQNISCSRITHLFARASNCIYLVGTKSISSWGPQIWAPTYILRAGVQKIWAQNTLLAPAEHNYWLQYFGLMSASSFSLLRQHWWRCSNALACSPPTPVATATSLASDLCK